MKNFAKLIKLTLIATLFVSLFSCSDDDTIEPVNNSIAAVASRAPQFTTLVAALDRAGLVQTLDQNGPFTVFAPTNDAFEDFLDANNFATLNDVPVPLLTQVLLNHVVGGTNLAANVTTGYVNSSAAYSNSQTIKLSLFLEKTGTNIKVNGVANVSATARDILATNGVIHQVDAVIGLATIVDHAKANPLFSTLYSVVTSPAQSSIATALTTNTTPLTVFAPTNAAFDIALGTGGFANGADDATVTTVLQYHVTNAGNVRSSMLTNGPVPMLSGEDITIDLTTPNMPKIDDKSMPLVKTNIIAVDVQCTNGIIHAVDKVLQPTL